MPPGQKDNNRVKKLVSTKYVAASAASIPRTTNIVVAIKLWKVFFATSFNDLSANLQPTEAPKINKQKSMLCSGNLYEAISEIWRIPLDGENILNLHSEKLQSKWNQSLCYSIHT